jgi:hypothetical protein
MTDTEKPIIDYKNRVLKIGDLVILANSEDLDNDEIQHNVGDVLQFIGGEIDNIGCFIHCKYNKRTDFFAERTLKITNK